MKHLVSSTLLVMLLVFYSTHRALGHAIQSLSTGREDSLANGNAFTLVTYHDTLVPVYSSALNGQFSQEPYKWIFYYIPLMLPAQQPNHSWIQLVDKSKVSVQLIQYNEEIEQLIRDAVATRVQDADAVYSSKWSIQPLMIHSLTGYVKDSEDRIVSEIDPVSISQPQTKTATLQFRCLSEEMAKQMIDSISNQEYKIEILIHLNRTLSSANAVSQSIQSFQSVFSNTITFGSREAAARHVLVSHKNKFASELVNQLKETLDESLSENLTDIQGLIERALAKQEQNTVEVDLYSEVWMSEYLKPSTIEAELDKLFNFSQEETSRRQNSIDYFVIVESYLNEVTGEEARSNQNGVKWSEYLHEQLRAKDMKVFSADEIVCMLEKSGVGAEWNGNKFVAKTLKVWKMEEVKKEIKSNLISEQMADEIKQGAIVKKVKIDGFFSTESKVMLPSQLESIVQENVTVDDESSKNESQNKLVDLEDGIRHQPISTTIVPEHFEPSTDQISNHESEPTTDFHRTTLSSDTLTDEPANVLIGTPIGSIQNIDSYPRMAVLTKQNYLAVGRNYLRMYDLSTRELLWQKKSSIVRDLKPFRDNELIKASDRSIEILNVESGELLQSLSGNLDKFVLTIALNRDESLMLSGGSDGNVFLWNTVDQFERINSFGESSAAVYSVIFDESRGLVIAGSDDGIIRAWDQDDGSLVQAMTGHNGTVYKLVLDESSGFLYSAGFDSTIKQWNLHTGECVRTLTGHTKKIKDLILIAEQNILVSASDDRTALVWDMDTHRVFKKLSYESDFFRLAHNSPSTSSHHPDLISSSIDGTILFWSL